MSQRLYSICNQNFKLPFPYSSNLYYSAESFRAMRALALNSFAQYNLFINFNRSASYSAVNYSEKCDLHLSVPMGTLSCSPLHPKFINSLNIRNHILCSIDLLMNHTKAQHPSSSNPFEPQINATFFQMQKISTSRSFGYAFSKI